MEILGKVFGVRRRMGMEERNGTTLDYFGVIIVCEAH